MILLSLRSRPKLCSSEPETNSRVRDLRVGVADPFGDCDTVDIAQCSLSINGDAPDL